MNNHLETFKKINTINDILDSKESFSNEDGESSFFELKGTKNSRLTKEDKKRISKEISAFSNTYGGIICFHSTNDDNEILGFDEDVSNLKKSITGWINDTLEPKLEGIDFKEISGVFVFYVPEGKNKPYRAIDRIQYYRVETNSLPMPEIMVRSMYLMRGYLDITASCFLRKLDNGTQISIHTSIKNLSNLSGTFPKVKMVVYPKFFTGRCNFFQPQGRVADASSYETFPQTEKYPRNIAITSGKGYEKNILYAKDHLFYTITSDSKFNDIIDVNEFFVQVDWLFKERERKRIYCYFNTLEDESYTFEENERDSLYLRYFL